MPNQSLPATPCPAPTDLSRFALKQLSAQDSAQVQTHLRICAACRRFVDEAKTIQQSEFATQDAPPAVRRHCVVSTIDLTDTKDLPLLAAKAPASGSSTLQQRYRIGAEIARGGMGVVHRATDLLFKREVAIKLLHPKLQNHPQAVEAFRYEAEITARLQHPGIPPIHDLGTLPNGQPFLAMKLIQGKTLHELLKARVSLSEDLPRWLQIFEQIAQAVGYAHSQNIIHRDLKPLNVMVGEFGEVQVMDWGLAKVVGEQERVGFAEPEEDEAKWHFVSRQGDVKGTLRYMPPEQARGEIAKLDSRADVFGLGAILCEILTGEPLYLGQTKQALKEEARACDMQPVFTRIRAHKIDADIFALVERCVAANPTDRFASGTAVAQSAAAHRTTIEKRLRRAETDRALGEQRLVEQTRRMKLWYVIAASLLLVVLVSGGLAVVYARSNSIIADRERKARNEETISTAVNNFLRKDLLAMAGADEQADAGLQADPDLKVRDLVLRAAEKIEGQFSAQPLVEARIRMTLGIALRQVGEYQAAVKQHARARDLYQQLSGPNDPDTIISLQSLAISCEFAGQIKEAIGLHNHVLALQVKKLGPDHPDTLSAMLNKANVLLRDGQQKQALTLAEETFSLMKDKLGAEHPDSINCQSTLAFAYRASGQLKRAIPLLEEVMNIRKAKLGLTHPNTLGAMFNAADARKEAADFGRAIALHDEVLRLRRAALGPRHPHTLSSMSSLAATFQLAGQLQQAFPLYEESLRVRQEKLGADHPETLESINLLANAYDEAGQFDKALTLFEQSVKLKTAKFGLENPSTLGSMSGLASAYLDVDKYDEALSLFEETLKLQKMHLGTDHPDTLITMGNLALLCRRLGDSDRAVALSEETWELRKKKMGPEHPDTLAAMNNLANAYSAVGKLERALPLFEETWKLRKSTLGARNPATLGSLGNLAIAYHDCGRLAEALPLYEETLQLMEEELGVDHPRTLAAMSNLASAYKEDKQPERAIAMSEEVVQRQTQKLGEGHSDTLRSIGNLANAYKTAGKIDRAIELHQSTYELSKTRLGLEHPDTLHSLKNLAATCSHAGQCERAIPLYKELIELRRRLLGPEHPETLHALLDLAITEGQLKQFAEAKMHLLETWELLQKLPPQVNQKLARDVAVELTYHFKDTDNPTEMKKWNQEAEKLEAALRGK